MNTTIQTVIDPSTRLARQAWRTHARSRTATAAQHAAFGLLLDRDLAAMFTPVSNATKLANGARPHAARDEAIATALSGLVHAWAPWAHMLETAHVQEKWGRKYYDMASHPLLSGAMARAPK